MKYNETDFAKIVASDKRYPEIFGPVEHPCNFKGRRLKIDIFTQHHVYECKFGANAWKDAIGQVLSYAMLLEKRAGIIIFIRTNPKFQKQDLTGYELLKKTVKQYKLPIDVERFYVNRESGKISKMNTLTWEVETSSEQAATIEETLQQIEDTNKVSTGLFGALKNLL